MSDLSTLLYQFLKNKFGDIDWDNGSVLRELVAAPIVALAEQATQAISVAYNALNISALLADPEGNSEAIDQLFSYLGLTTPTPTYATGSVRLLLTSPDSFIIPSGASFSYNNTILSVNNSYTVSVGANTTDSTLPITNVRYNVYQVIVPVTANTTGVSLAEGTELVWNMTNRAIYSATVYSAISGGSSDYTATEKINQIRQTLFPQSLSCAEGFLKAINNYASGLAVDCLISSARPQNAVELYVKTVQAPKVWQIAITGTPTGKDNEYSAVIDGTGISVVRSILEPSAALTGVAWIGNTATVTWTNTTATANATLEVFGLPNLVTAQRALDKYTENMGIKILVKVPRLLEMSMYLPTTASTLSTEAISRVVSAINNSLLNATGLGDHTTSPILQASGISMQGAGTYTLRDMVYGNAQTSVATANTTGFANTDEPFAIYTSSDKITVSQNA